MTDNAPESSGYARPARHLWSVDLGQNLARIQGADASRGDISVYDQDGGVTVLLRGHIDLAQAQELEEIGGYAIEQEKSILVDVRHVVMIDSVGISFLVRVAALVRSRGGIVTLCGPAPLVEEMLSVAGASPLFEWTQGRLGPEGQATP